MEVEPIPLWLRGRDTPGARSLADPCDQGLTFCNGPRRSAKFLVLIA